MDKTSFKVTREKHLDHMVRVVPFIVAAYAIQCFLIIKLGPGDFASDALFYLGGCLISMIVTFITYDMTHVVNFSEDKCTISIAWLGYEKSISYRDISSLEVSDPGQTFSTLTIKLKDGKNFGFYFVDDADKIKSWLEEKRSQKFQVAA